MPRHLSEGAGEERLGEAIAGPVRHARRFREHLPPLRQAEQDVVPATDQVVQGRIDDEAIVGERDSGLEQRDEGKDAEELNTRFSELDTNNDNKLSRDEYNALNKSARGASGATGSNKSK